MNLFADNSDKIIAISLLFGSGLLFRFVLQFFGQTWIKTKSHTVTLILLPIITYVITNVISGNIALSLGMVGALSIVRFRNPVRSPLELSTYFAAITMGISASVSLKWLLFLIVSILAVIIILSVINFAFKVFLKKPMFIVSFSEGNNLSTLIIDTSETIDLCEKSELLQSKIVTKDKITYSLASDNFSKLKQIEDSSEIQKRSNSIQLSR